MSTDYTKKKNAELEDLLKARSLPHTGKKAELVARLQQYDADKASKPSTTAPAAAGAEDEIDWEDDAVTATDAPGAAAIAAGGLTQPANPTAVPNQIVDTDPSKTEDLTVKLPAADGVSTGTETKSGTTEPEKPKVDFAAGLSSTDLDSELAKRKARAAKFGLQESNEDALKALERAKKFGTGSEGDKVAVKGLDQALPERGVKRGRGGEGNDEGRQGKRSRVRGGRGNEGMGRRERSGTPKGGKKEGGGRGYSEADRVAAEKRKARFNAA